MIARSWTGLAAVGTLVAAFALQPPTLASMREPAQWLVRPVALPFAWRSLKEASKAGDADETFARAQQILHLLPSWTDAQIVFAFRFATDGGATTADAADPEAAHARLQIALAWLESARADAGRREIELLLAMAMLPELAVAQHPTLATRLDGGGAALADRYLAAAERLSGSPAVRERRTFFVVNVVAGLLASGDRKEAIALLEVGIRRSADVRDRETATEWAARLAEVRQFLRSEVVDLTAVRADLRMAPLLPYLR